MKVDNIHANALPSGCTFRHLTDESIVLADEDVCLAVDRVECQDSMSNK